VWTSQPLELRGHKQAVTSVAISKEANRVVSGSLDHTARVWGLSGKKDALSLDGCVRLAGHGAGVSSVCVRGEQIVTASADKTLKIWAMPTQEDLASRAGGARKAGSRKAAKVDDENTNSNEESVKTRGCLATLIGHTQPVSVYPYFHCAYLQPCDNLFWPPGCMPCLAFACLEGNERKRVLTVWHSQVTGACFGDEGHVWSGSWDHSVRCWDMDTLQDTVTLSGGHAVSSLSACHSDDEKSKATRLVASGHTDRVIRIWDPRTTQAAMVAHSLHSHKGWVTGGELPACNLIYLFGWFCCIFITRYVFF
jgi:WD40 repeat protein